MLDSGVSYIPEDRQEDGIVERFSLADNLVLDLYNRPPYASGLALHLDAIRESAAKHMEEYDIRATSIDMTVGNAVGRQPAKGHRRPRARPRRDASSSPTSRPAVSTSARSSSSTTRSSRPETTGTAVLICSTELDEIYALADRILVMYEGKIAGERPPTVSIEELGLLMAGAGMSGREWRRRNRHERTTTPDRAGAGSSAHPVRLQPPARRQPARAPRRRADVLAPKGPAVANSLLNAVLEGSSTVVTILAIFVAIVIGGLLIAFTSPPVLHAWSHVFSAPGAAFSQAWDVAASAYSAMFEGAIVNPHTISAAFHGGSTAAIFNPLSETAVNATPLILAGLAVALAFRAGMFNIGATGQFIGGAMIAGWIGFAVHLPMVIHVVVAVIGGFVGGAIVGWFVGDLKARTGAHEVIVTIMLNYVMEFLLLFLLGLTVFRAAGSPNPISPPVVNNAMLPHLAGANLRINAGFLARPGGRGGRGVAAQHGRRSASSCARSGPTRTRPVPPG